MLLFGSKPVTQDTVMHDAYIAANDGDRRTLCKILKKAAKKLGHPTTRTLIKTLRERLVWPDELRENGEFH